jgi:hypothetical protein
MRETFDLLSRQIFYLDWSQGQGLTIPGHLDQEIEQLGNLGWSPDFIIFDWIGGGLESSKQRDHLRHLYQESADYIVTHCKKTGRSAIVLAQLDKTKATNRQRTTMDMLSECKSMPNNYTNFVGISALREDAEVAGGTDRNLGLHQFLNVEKSRQGPGGLVPVEAYFRFQRFRDRQRTLQGGS